MKVARRLTLQKGDYLVGPSAIAMDRNCGGGRQGRGERVGQPGGCGLDGAGRGHKPRDASSSQRPRGKKRMVP